MMRSAQALPSSLVSVWTKTSSPSDRSLSEPLRSMTMVVSSVMVTVTSPESVLTTKVSPSTELTSPDTLTIHDDMGLIATVGRGMIHNPGTAARLFTALSREHVNVRMIDQGSSELSILVGVDCCDFEQAIRAIYHEFVK